MDDVVLLRHGIFGSPQYSEDRLPQIDLRALPVPKGIAPPLVRGVDRNFFWKHRVFPPISPAPGSRLGAGLEHFDPGGQRDFRHVDRREISLSFDFQREAQRFVRA